MKNVTLQSLLRDLPPDAEITMQLKDADHQWFSISNIYPETINSTDGTPITNIIIVVDY
jgi:uncharacterized lipoprotein YbaY